MTNEEALDHWAHEIRIAVQDSAQSVEWDEEEVEAAIRQVLEMAMNESVKA